ncbi:MAG: site-specific integrase [Candidatus Dormiibacterota bacterium]
MRRKQGEGSVFKRKNKEGKVIGYTAFLNLGRKANGKRDRRKFQGKTWKEVQARLEDAKEQSKKGILPATGKRTVGMWMEAWLQDVAKPTVRPSTYRSYEGFVKQHINPVLGHIALEKLTAGDVRAMLNSRAGLSPRSVQHLRAVLRTGLNVAIKDGLIPSQRNVAGDVKPPKVPRREMKTYDGDQAHALLRVVAGDPLEAVYVLALTTGMRQGEILGLRWRSVDLEAGTLRVDYALQRVAKVYKLVEPKSENSRRVVPLSAITLAALRAHKAKQQETAQQPGTIRNLEWHDLVFRTTTGQPLSGSWVYNRFKAAAKAADLPAIRFHDARHSVVSILGEAGVDVATVSKLVGHSNVSLTMNTYRHVFEKAKREAANAMDAALSEAARKYTAAAAR